MSKRRIRLAKAQKKTGTLHLLEPKLVQQAEQSLVRLVAPHIVYRRAQVNRNGLTLADLLALQRAVGNRRVQRMVARRINNADGQQQTEITARESDLNALQPKSFASHTISSLPKISSIERKAQITHGAKIPASVSPAERAKRELLEVVRVLDRMVRDQELEPGEWRTLVVGKRWLAPTTALLQMTGVVQQISDEQLNLLDKGSEVVESYFGFAGITWENITDDQRIVFLALNATNRERIRTSALKKSPLFNAITEMHVPSTTAQEDLGTKRSSVTHYRLREEGTTPPNPTYGVPGSAAAALTESETARCAIVDPVRVTGNNLTRFPNRGLAEWVQAQGDYEKAVKALHNLACGLTNLYVLALAHGEAKTSQPGHPPSVDDTIAWLRRWSLDAPQGKRLVTGSKKSGLGYDPTVILKDISRTTSVPTSRSSFEKPEGEHKAGKEFGAFMQREARVAGQQATRNTRLALAQGKTKTHSFLIYKDIDSVWRTMDVYLGLEDLAAYSLGYPRHSQKVITLYFVVDPKVALKAGVGAGM